MKLLTIGGMLAILGCATWSLAEAAEQKPAAAPAAGAPGTPGVASDPSTTSASYGDWVLRCQRQGQADKAQKLCEVAQVIQVKGQPAPIAQVAFGKLSANDPLRMTVALPANITLPSSVHFALSDKDPQPMELAWHRCLPGTCLADIVPSAEALKAIRGAGDSGRILFKDSTNRDVAVPVSFRGLPQALDALAKAS